MNNEELHKTWSQLKPLDRFSEYLPGLGLAKVRRGLHLEFGVWKGGSINYLADFLKPQEIHGFDSFQGLPEDWEMNKDGEGLHKEGHFQTPIPNVRQNVKLHVGLFQNTLPSFLRDNEGPIGYINIDCDLYSSAIFVLRTLNERIVPGTIIRFDEICQWGGKTRYENWEDGEWRALHEWMTEFKREVRPVSRTSSLQGTIEVTK